MAAPDERQGAASSFSGRRLTRRELLRTAGAVGAGIGFGAGGVGAISAATEASPPEDAGSLTYPFHGRHQAGIATPAQSNLNFAAFDVTTGSRAELRDVLRAWSEAAGRMCAGKPAGKENDEPFLPPDDTGEAFGLPAAGLTVTIGFGPTLFERDGDDRFGLAKQRPEALAGLPPLPGDSLRPEKSGGDLCVQACANNPQVSFHAVRNLARIARGAAVVRWSQLGFGRTSSTSESQQTPRNLFGLKDGTNNIKAEDKELMDRYVWAGAGPGWMEGGTYLVARRIRMLIEVWDRSPLDDQERTIGRHKMSGAPLGGKGEFDPVDLKARRPDGRPVIPVDAHIRLAGEEKSEKILRRGYSFTDGMDPASGQLDAGLFFICFQRDPRQQFVPLQERLGKLDALNEYILHTGSAVFACPPGAQKGGYVGESLFDKA